MKTLRTYYKPFALLLFVGAFFATPLVTYAVDFNISGIIISVSGFLLGIAANTFNWAINLFVLQMGANITGSTGSVSIGLSIDIIWKIIRDLVNLTFIFGLVYVGFKTILNAGTDTKQMLSSIIMGALLVNFSLFVSKVVIDVSNVSAAQIYKGMNIKTSPQTTELGVAGLFLARMGIVQLYTLPGAGGTISSRFQSGIGKDDNSVAFVIGASVFVLVATVVFFAGATLLIIRFGVLVILMMLSPLAFATSTFPSLKAYRDKWWSTMFNQAFFAPAYMFMLYLTLKVADGYRSQTLGFDGIYDPSLFSTGYTSLVFFLLTITMLVASLVIAKQMGAIGASRALGVLKTAGSWARTKARNTALAPVRGTVSAVAAIGRGTIGAKSHTAFKSPTLQRMSARKGVAGLVGRTLTTVAKKGAEASFDARRVAGVGKTLGIGEGKKGGYVQRLKDIQKKETDRVKALGEDERLYESYSAKVQQLHRDELAYEKSLAEEYRKLAQAQTDAERANAISQIQDYATKIADINDKNKNEDYVRAKDFVEKALKREYAANLEARGEDLKLGMKHIYHLLVRSQKENKEAADAIRKEVGKDKADKQTEAITEAIKGIQTNT